MKISTSYKFWLIFTLIIISAFLGGVFGNWAFIYLLEKYYGVPNGNYSSGNSSAVVIRETKSQISQSSDNFNQALSSANRSLIRIFKKESSGLYYSRSALALGVVMTNDGWLASFNKLEPDKNGSWQEYEAITYDKKVFTIESVKYDFINKVYFIHLNEAKNLTVNNLTDNKNLFIGKKLFSIGLDDTVDFGNLLFKTNYVNSSDKFKNNLSINGANGRSAYFYDTAGQFIGFFNEGIFIFSGDMERGFEKLLTENRISYPYLGLYYINLADVYDTNSRVGALITSPGKDIAAVEENSPAAKAGIKAGDIITALDNTPVNEFNDLRDILLDYEVGENIELSIRRDKETIKLSVILGEMIEK